MTIAIPKFLASAAVMLSLAAFASASQADQMPTHCWIVYDYRVVPHQQATPTAHGQGQKPAAAQAHRNPSDIDAANSIWYDGAAPKASVQGASSKTKPTAVKRARVASVHR